MDNREPEEIFDEYLRSLGVDPDHDPRLADTSVTVTKLLRRFFQSSPEPALYLMPYEGHGHIALRSLRFYSLCEHHLVPFFGTMDVLYTPHRQIAGLGGIERCIAHYSTGPQIQERLTDQIADFLFARISPKGLMVISRARQMCLELNGCSPGAEIIAMAPRGDATERDYSALLQTGASL